MRKLGSFLYLNTIFLFANELQDSLKNLLHHCRFSHFD